MNAKQQMKDMQLRMERRFEEFAQKLDKAEKKLSQEKAASEKAKKDALNKKDQEEYDNYLISIGKKKAPSKMTPQEQAEYDKYVSSLGLGQKRK
ncbi:hypothetical protein PDJ95_08535 [Bacillus cereus]|nr:hypothetical protein [Bacillus cereus]